MKNKRKDISFKEDILEESLGRPPTKEETEIIEMFFDYIVNEIRFDAPIYGFRIPKIGTITQNYYLLKGYSYTIKDKLRESRRVENRLATIRAYSDELGGKTKHLYKPFLIHMESFLKSKFDIGKSLFLAPEIYPIFFTATEAIQNRDFNKKRT